MSIKIDLAPLEGVTTAQYRRVQSRHFAPPSRSFTPFISPTQNHRFTNRELGEILPEVNEGLNVIPQLIGHNAEDFLWAAGELKAMGYDTVNLNLGCPSPTVTKKKKGAGLLGDIPLLTDFLDRIFDASPLKISAKTRIGRESLSEAEELAKLFARYPFSEVIVHPRLEKDFYKGAVSFEAFELFLRALPGKVSFNGDLFDREEVLAFAGKYGESVGIMCGRGFIANPKLAGEVNGETPLTKEEFRDFYDDLFSVTAARLHSEVQILLHIKEYWAFWSRIFEQPEAPLKRVLKAKSVVEYSAAVSVLFSSCSLRNPAGFSVR